MNKAPHKILHIDSSVFGENGQSSLLTSKIVKGLKAIHTDVHVIHRSFQNDPIPHFDAATMGAIGKGEAELADILVKEIQQADTVVIGAPMYNFGVPTQLKAWFDHIARAGTTFQYTESGPVGLLTGKHTIAVATMGGQHTGTARDSVTPWLESMFGLIGLNEKASIIQVQGLSQSALKDAAREKAEQDVDALLDQIESEQEAA